MKIELLGSMRMPNQSVRIMRAALDESSGTRAYMEPDDHHWSEQADIARLKFGRAGTSATGRSWLP